MIEKRRPKAGEEQELLSLDEDQFHDLKSRQIKPAKLHPHFVAMANSDGGDLYVGIEDKKVTGQRIRGFTAAEEANELIHVLLETTEPVVDGVEFEFLDFGARGLVLHVSVPKSAKVHYTADRECYVRMNASSRKAVGDRVTQLGYSKGAFSYERVMLEDVSASDVADGRYIKTYLNRLKSTQDVMSFLRKSKLIVRGERDEHPTVGCVLLLHDEPQAALNTRCAIKVYRLRTTSAEYKREQLDGEPQTIEGPLEQQILAVISAVNVLLKEATYHVDGELIKLEYPCEALKEILVNAVLHRDYSLNDDIHVRIYDNRIEIQSPGRLPGYITPSNILKERFARNPGIVRLLHKLPNPAYLDIGEGLNTAFNEMRKAGLVEPEIEELHNSVRVTVKHQLLASLEDVILKHLDSHLWVTNRDVQVITGENSSRVGNAIRKLRDCGRIEPVDPEAVGRKLRYRKIHEDGASPSPAVKTATSKVADASVPGNDCH